MDWRESLYSITRKTVCQHLTSTNLISQTKRSTYVKPDWWKRQVRERQRLQGWQVLGGGQKLEEISFWIWGFKVPMILQKAQSCWLSVLTQTSSMKPAEMGKTHSWDSCLKRASASYENGSLITTRRLGEHGCFFEKMTKKPVNNTPSPKDSDLILNRISITQRA